MANGGNNHKGGRPKKKPGEPKSRYNYSKATLAKRAAQKKVAVANKKIEQAKNKQKRAQASAKKARDNLRKMEKVSKGKAALTETDLKTAPKPVRELYEENVAFRANPGPQEEFLAAPERDVLYGGAAGGGKSFAVLVDGLRYIHRPAHRVLILRKTLKELRELISASKTLYRRAFPDAKYSETKNIWTFPSGATLEFGYLDRDDDVEQYQGQAFSYIAIDEITHYATPYVWIYLRSRLRTTDPEITTYMRCTANPGSTGSWWVKKMYIDPAPPNTPFDAIDIETGEVLKKKDGSPAFQCRFIPARLTDNPYLMQDDAYESMLYSLPEVERRRLLEGDWDVADGAAFTEFSREKHVIEPFDIPRSWTRIRAADYGYASPACVLWGAVDFDGNIYIYREFYGKGYTAERLAEIIIELEAGDPPMQDYILDSSCWNKTGVTGPSIADQMEEVGVQWRPANRAGSTGTGTVRISGKQEVHRRLQATKEDGRGLKIFKTCTNLIRTLPILPLSKTNSEDVDTKAEDHAYDALRYMFDSRPDAARDLVYEFRMQNARKGPEPLDDIFGV